MNLNTLNNFRHEIYQCFARAGDALAGLADALLTETQAHSVIELTLSPFYQRQWPSLYESLQTGKVDRSRLEATLARYAPGPQPGQRLVVAVDATNLERPFSETSPDRTDLFVHNLPECEKPVTVGWQFSTVAVMPEMSSSWSYILSNRRIESGQTPAQVAAQQLRDLTPHLPQRPLCLGDRYYPSMAFLVATSEVECDLLLRLKANRVLYRAVPPLPPGVKRGRGAPPKHGSRFVCKDPSTHDPPDLYWEGPDEKGQMVRVRGWRDLHLRQAIDRPAIVFEVEREGANGNRRDPKLSWFMWVGQDQPGAEEVWPTYLRRYSIEHTFRFAGQDLLWTELRVRWPDQFERWTSIVSAVQDQLVLGREFFAFELRPWESPRRSATPQQVRRGLGRIISELGTPARPCKPRGKGPGRRIGAVVSPAVRYKVVKKGGPKGRLPLT